jgi:predicted transposase YbfD/YdcC
MPLTCRRASWPGSAGLRTRCAAGSSPPGETRIRTLVQAVGADLLDDLVGGWLRALADAGRLDEALTAIAIDGKWLRGVLDGQVKLFAAMLHQEKVIIGQVRVPDGTTEVTQAKALLGGVDLENAVVAADAVHSCRETAQYIAGKREDGGREADYLLFVKGNTPSLQRAAFDAVQQSGPGRAPDYTELDRSRGRVTRRSIWVADAGHRLPAGQASRADPPRRLRRRRVPHQQGDRPRRHQPQREEGRRAPSRPSHATATACLITFRYETQVSNDSGDPVA